MIEIKTPIFTADWEVYYDLRYRVLREPLGKERGSEQDPGDLTGIHFALYENEIIRAIARLDRITDTICQVRFVAVESSIQNKGYGRKIMEAVEQRGKENAYKRIILHARDYALPFYQKLGYVLVGPSYKLFGSLQHFEMYKDLS